MALTIKSIPVLKGKAAKTFIRKAEENERIHRDSCKATLSKEYFRDIDNLFIRSKEMQRK